MVGLVEPPVPPPLGAGFSVAQQKVHLDIDFLFKRIRGKTDITIIPHSTDLKTITFNSRQANITRLSINNRVAPATFHHDDPYEHTQLRWESGVNQHHMLQERLQKWTKTPSEHEIVLTLPPKFKITGAPPMNIVDNLNKSAEQADLSQNTKNVLEQAAQFNPITIYIEYTVENIRDGMNFVGWVPEDLRYPHAYTLNSSTAQVACCLFPCIDSIDSKCTWDIQIRTPRTLGDALGDPIQNSIIDTSLEDRTETPNGHRDDSRFSAEDRALDLIVVCSGDMTDEIVDPLDSSKKTTSFSCTKPVSAQHIGFAIGPFEAVNLAAFRESDEDDKLGRNAIPIHAFCLPGRADEVKNTCLPMAKAMDYFVITYGSYPFSSYKLCFVDDIVLDQFNTYSLSLCSNRLLFPPEILNPMDSVTRTLIFGLACQWIGVNVTPREPTDLWVVVGIAFFITDMFLRKLSGNNEYRYQQKRNADRVCDMDKARPSIFDSGRHISLDPTHYELISAKAPLVLFILDRRLTKASGSTGLSRSISRIFLNATVGDLPDSTLSTAYFTKTVERLSHSKLEPFFNQWVYGAGCPYFRVTQRFNKKRLVVEMTIHQVQQESTASNIQTENFIRDVKEDAAEVYAGQPQHVFTGPMTIRIHEADGIPYEHIIDIRDAKTTVEIPYNTKYKRLKRSRRHREKLIASGGADVNLDGQEEGVLYSLGEILQSEEEMRDWQLAEWSKDDEDKISGESYEWIRMDADFEWICRTVTNMPGYMYISQLQQDRDVVAQYEVSFLHR